MLFNRICRYYVKWSFANDICVVSPGGYTSVWDVVREEILGPEAFITFSSILCSGSFTITGKAVDEYDTTRQIRERILSIVVGSIARTLPQRLGDRGRL